MWIINWVRESLVIHSDSDFDCGNGRLCCYVEMYSEQWVSFCLQNCKYKLILYFVIFRWNIKYNEVLPKFYIILDFENFINLKYEFAAKLLSNF